MIRLGVIASGGGSNLQAILDACAARRIDAEVGVVVSNVPEAHALERARQAGVPAVALPSMGVKDREGYDRQLVQRLRDHGADLVCLAGYMRFVSPTFLEAFGPTPATRGCPRVMNIHPSLLPAFPGLHGQRQAFEYGARFAGCTVHFVDVGCDTGPVIVQAVVPVVPGDEEKVLVKRILAEEHKIYPQAIQWFAQGRLALVGRFVTVDGARAPIAGALVNPPLD